MVGVMFLTVEMEFTDVQGEEIRMISDHPQLPKNQFKPWFLSVQN